MLQKIKHKLPARKQDAPHHWNTPTYGKQTQYAENEPDAPVLPANEINKCQQITGTLLYYAIAVDPTMLVSLGDIAANQSKATEDTRNQIYWLLDYAATHPDAKITYSASNMIIRIHSDASYLSVPRARSRGGGHFYLSLGISNPPLNCPIHYVSKILKMLLVPLLKQK